MKFLTALRQPTIRKLEQLSRVDIVVGIPTYFSADTIGNVIRNVEEGLKRYFPNKRSLIFVSDGGSTDDTREVAKTFKDNGLQSEIIVMIYRGIPGKGSAVRAIFEASKFLEVEAVALFDSDLRSITPAWVRNILVPIFEGFDFVAPYYKRFKYDGTITNSVVYPMVRSVFGYDIRQPIGGDFGLSPKLVRSCLEQDVWETDVARFGIDIWLTLQAIIKNMNICQVRLGAKIHNVKDPARHLGRMFVQVIGTLFSMLKEYQDFWMNVKEIKQVPTFGEFVGVEPQPFKINKSALIDYFKLGFENFGYLWRRILDEEEYRTLEKLYHIQDDDYFIIKPNIWARIVYKFADVFNEIPRQKFKVLSTLVPIYNGMVASMVNMLEHVDHDEAEEYFQTIARSFEEEKDYLINLWKSEEEIPQL